MRVVSARTLTALVRAFCAAGGSDRREADAVARNLVDANLAGHDSHGVGILPAYAASMADGWLKPNRRVAVAGGAGAALRLDGNLGYGQVIGGEAMALGIERARAQGAALVALRMSHHLGRIGAWAEQCAEAGMASIHYVNSGGYRPSVAPFGAAEARYATNPYCTGIPAGGGRGPIILDFATSAVAMGKVRVARNAGTLLREEALMDPEGRRTRDPAVMYADPRGALLPMGGHKGYGMALICEALAGALTNGGAHLPRRDHGRALINNMFSVIADPAAIGDGEYFRDEIAALADHVTSAAPARGAEEVMLPGDPERKARARRLAEGIPVDEETLAQIYEGGAKIGLDPADARRIVEDAAPDA